MVERFPIVTIDRQLKGIPLSFVGTNNEEAARELANYLLNEGYKKNMLCHAGFQRDLHYCGTSERSHHGFP